MHVSDIRRNNSAVITREGGSLKFEITDHGIDEAPAYTTISIPVDKIRELLTGKKTGERGVAVGFLTTADLPTAVAAVDSEMAYQLRRWPEDLTGRHPQDRSIDEWWLYIQQYALEGVEATTHGDEQASLGKMRAVAAMCLIAMQQNGVGLPALFRRMPSDEELAELHAAYRSV